MHLISERPAPAELEARPTGAPILTLPAAVPSRALDLLIPLLLTVGMFLVGAYYVLRQGALSSENDMAVQAIANRAVMASGSLAPSGAPVYTNGFSYAALSAALVAFGGLQVDVLQQVLHPLLALLIVFPAWTFFRELTPTRRVAALATILFLTQPEVLFVLMRGSHERLLRTLMLVSLFLLARSFRYRDQPQLFMVHVGLFYLAAFTLIATNALFGMSFVIAVGTAFAIAWLVGLWRRRLRGALGDLPGRLATIVLATTALGFLVMFYIYPPALDPLPTIGGFWPKLVAFLLTTQSGINPYSYTANAWINLGVYFALSISDYLLILLTAPIWLYQGFRWLTSRVERPSQRDWLLWMLYGAFAVQSAFAIIADRTGVLGGNLQHRSFPSFVMMAVPLLAVVLLGRRTRRLPMTALTVALVLLAGLSILKATNEPAVSNTWTFYAEPEMTSLRWIDAHNRDAFIWVGPNERLSTAYGVAVGPSANGNDWDIYTPKANVAGFLVTEIIRMQSLRLGDALPIHAGMNLLYDNGFAQFYRLRPQTRYQS